MPEFRVRGSAHYEFTTTVWADDATDAERWANDELTASDLMNGGIDTEDIDVYSVEELR